MVSQIANDLVHNTVFYDSRSIFVGMTIPMIRHIAWYFFSLWSKTEMQDKSIALGRKHIII